MLKWFIAPVVVYGAFVALVYLAQRFLQYFPERRRTAPAAIGLANAEEVVLDTADGERVIAWHVPPRNGQSVFVYFHGNGGSLRWREERFRDLIDDGSGRAGDDRRAHTTEHRASLAAARSCSQGVASTFPFFLHQGWQQCDSPRQPE
jgi:hypothetical protein